MPAIKRKSIAEECWSVPLKCNLVKTAIKQVSDLPPTVKEMLCASLAPTFGAVKDTRHPSCQRLVGMVGEVLSTLEATLVKDESDKKTILEDLKPAKATRESTLEVATAKLKEIEEAYSAAVAAVSGAEETLKVAAADLAAAQKAQKIGDKDADAIAAKKVQLEGGYKDTFTPLSEGTAVGADVKKLLKNLMTLANAFSFDASLMNAVNKVLIKEKSVRTEFDSTCTQQVEESFQNAIASLDAQIAEAAPAKAERAAVVEQHSAKKTAAEDALAARQAEREAVKTQVADGKTAVKTGKKAIADFYPDLQAASDAFDEATATLAEFREGALAAYEALKERNEEWKPPAKAPRKAAPVEETVDGQTCDQEMIDASGTAVIGQGDGLVSVEAAKSPTKQSPTKQVA